MKPVTMSPIERHAACQQAIRPSSSRYHAISRECLPRRTCGDAFPRAVGRLLVRLVGRRRTLLD